ncbi:hypothetical protein CC86DRAFT_372057 [Ophiobolus disseminans]|uniref:Uncharacterized protein n=1 Tax=Ophiobolus disseminans TaxID=1469910 RepID=A0A6A6ZU70_9PLEO|nr:hypothetical protein CC86DRAFT_372057 [Ophiobolus disseminans]
MSPFHGSGPRFGALLDVPGTMRAITKDINKSMDRVFGDWDDRSRHSSSSSRPSTSTSMLTTRTHDTSSTCQYSDWDRSTMLPSTRTQRGANCTSIYTPSTTRDLETSDLNCASCGLPESDHMPFTSATTRFPSTTTTSSYTAGPSCRGDHDKAKREGAAKKRG